MHQVRGPPDLHITLDWRLHKGVEQPACIVVDHQPVPFAAHDRDGRAHRAGIVAKAAMPGVDDVAERSERNLDAGWLARSAGRVAVEIGLAPSLEMSAGEHRRR